MQATGINLSNSKLQIPNEIMAEFSRAKNGREVRVCLLKGAKSVVKQMVIYGSWIPPIKPIFPMVKTSLEGAGMGAEALEAAEIVTVAEEGVVAGELFIPSAELAAEGLTVAEVGGGAVGTGAGGVALGPVGVVVIVIVVVVVVWWMFHSNISPDKRFLLDIEFRKLHRELMAQYKKAR